MKKHAQIWFLAVTLAIGLVISTRPSAYAQQRPVDEKDYVLILTSYAHDSKIVEDFIRDFEKASGNFKLEIQIESLNVLTLNNCNEWLNDLVRILSRQNYQYLKAVIIFGQEAMATYLSLGDQRPDVPFFATKVSEAGVIIPHETINPSTWEPMSISNRKTITGIGYGGAIFNKYDIAANVDLIKSLYPDTKSIALLTDNTYGGLSIHASFRKVMHEQYGDIQTILIDGRKLSIHEIQDTIASLPPNTALLLGTWRVDNKGTFFMGKLLTEFVNMRPDLPVFSLSGLGLNDIAIAGVTPRYEDHLDIFLDNIFTAINQGIRDTIFIEIPNELNVNMENLRKMKISENKLPENFKIVDTQNEEMLFYRRMVCIVGIVSAVMLIMLIYAIRMTLKTRRQNQLLNLQANELKTAKEQAEVSDKLKSAFLANISHQIRTPLNAITGFASLISNSNSINNIKEYLKYITESTDKLLRLLTLIVDFAKVDSGIIEFNMTHLELQKLFDTIYKHYASRMPDGINFECYKPYNCTIKYDPEKLEQIITILLDNAIKFTRSGLITMGYYAASNSVKIYVTDTGIGIQQNNITKIFNRFEKLDNFTEGTGIGLPFVKALIEKTGGSIHVVSRPEVGSRFIVDIPCDAAADTADIAPYDRTTELMNADTLIVDKQLEKTLKILVAEDNMSNVLLLKTILKTHEITHVSDGEAAVQALKNDWYDIVLMDIMMPNKDGITATAEIRKFDVTTPIIIVTAYTPDSYIKQAKNAGCDYFIEKPFTRSKLYLAILELMNK